MPYILPYPPGSPYFGNGSLVWIGLEYQENSWQWITGEPYSGSPPPYSTGWYTDVGQGLGPHAYLHTFYHPNPGTVWADPQVDNNQYWYPYGVIENVPEPSSLVLLGVGAISLFGCAWRRRRRTA
jgi:hypothetical protein